MAIKADPPAAFGVRRQLAYTSAIPLLDRLYELQDSNDIPDNIRARDALHVTLLPKRKLDNQLRRGIVIGYEFGRKASALEHDLKERTPGQVEIQLGRVMMLSKNSHVGIQVKSETLEEEHRAVLSHLGNLGMRGALKDIPALHVSLGDVEGKLTRFERNVTIDVLNETLPLDKAVMLDPIEFYPSNR